MYSIIQSVAAMYQITLAQHAKTDMYVLKKTKKIFG